MSHVYRPVNFALWDVLKPHAKSNLEHEVVLLHIFGIGGTSAILVTVNDVVYATGTNDSGRLGIGDKSSVFLSEIPFLHKKKVKCFSSGTLHTISLTENGQLYSWGDNFCGRLGNGTILNRDEPGRVILPDNIKIKSIACGDRYSLALATNNKVYHWGDVNFDASGGELIPTLYDFPEGEIIQITCGLFNAAALTTDGNVFVWGEYEKKVLFPLLIASNATSIGCGINSFVYISVGALFYNNEKIEEADDLVAHHQHICFRKGSDFFIRYENETKLIEVENFQSAFANLATPQFLRMSQEDYDKIVLYRTNNKPRNIYEALFNKKENSDLIIKLSDGPIYVHKLILLTFCDHFKSYLSGPWAAQAKNEIDMTDYNPKAYKAFLKYIYSGYLVSLDGPDLVDLYSIAESYLETGLKKIIVQLFKSSIVISNVCLLYNLCHKQHSLDLMIECWIFTSDKLGKVILTNGFDELEPDLAKSLLKNSALRGNFD